MADERRMGAQSAQLVLSSKAAAVMEMIAGGHSYEQILAAYPTLTYRDIFDAAAEVLTASRRGAGGEASHMQRLKDRHARAYEKWTPQEEEQLTQLIAEGHTVARIAGRLGRNRGAIRARLIRLGLMECLSEKEQDRQRRIMQRQAGDSTEGEDHA